MKSGLKSLWRDFSFPVLSVLGEKERTWLTAEGLPLSGPTAACPGAQGEHSPHPNHSTAQNQPLDVTTPQPPPPCWDSAACTSPIHLRVCNKEEPRGSIPFFTPLYGDGTAELSAAPAEPVCALSISTWLSWPSSVRSPPTAEPQNIFHPWVSTEHPLLTHSGAAMGRGSQGRALPCFPFLSLFTIHFCDFYPSEWRLTGSQRADIRIFHGCSLQTPWAQHPALRPRGTHRSPNPVLGAPLLLGNVRHRWSPCAGWGWSSCGSQTLQDHQGHKGAAEVHRRRDPGQSRISASLEIHLHPRSAGPLSAQIFTQRGDCHLSPLY